MTQKKHILIWLFSGCFLVYLMVVIGGITRLTHSGLSMVNWSLFGSFPPSTAEGWQQLFDNYKQYPEYQKVNFDFSLSDFKSIFWWEYIHRLLGRLIGLLFIIPFIYFWVKKQFSPKLLKNMLLILFLGGFQGFLGWFMVKSGLVNNPNVSHFRLAAHLMGALTVFGATFWTALQIIHGDTEAKFSNRLKKLHNASIVFFGLVIVQIIYGAFVAGLKAGHICPTWPQMCDMWIHDSVFTLAPTWKNFLENPAGVQFVHRYLAYAVVLMIVYIASNKNQYKLTDLHKSLIQLLLITVFVQFILGVLTLILHVPVLLGVLHQTGAFFLFSFALYLVFATHQKNPIPPVLKS